MSEFMRARFHGPSEGQPGHEFVNGLRAADHTAAEYAALTPAQQAQMVTVRRTGGRPMYTLHAPPPLAVPEGASVAGVPAVPVGMSPAAPPVGKRRSN